MEILKNIFKKPENNRIVIDLKDVWVSGVGRVDLTDPQKPKVTQSVDVKPKQSEP